MQNIIEIIQKNKNLKFFLFFTNDFIINMFATYFSLILRYEKFDIDFKLFLITIILAFLCYFPLIIFFKIYYQLHRYFNFNTIRFYLKIFFYYCFLLFFLVLIANYILVIPRSFPIINTFIFFFLIIINRFLITIFIKSKNEELVPKNTLIYGVQKKVIKLISNLSFNYNVKSIILRHSNENLKIINGINTFNEDRLVNELNSKKINSIILAVDKIDDFDLKKYIKPLYEDNISLLYFDSNNNIINLSQEIHIGSLLFRSEAVNDINLTFKNKIILITGGGGSIGTELSKQILKLDPKEIIIIDISEFNLFNLKKDLDNICLEYNLQTKIIIKLCDVSNINDTEYIINDKKIDYVYHAAAYKHVPIVEDNVFTALKNNFYATFEFAKLCNKLNVKNFTLVSSDKAVRPTNIMGVTKRLAEMSIIYLSLKSSTTNYSIVRFGNVLESSGSVIPEFKKQILKGGPITLTHMDITRYFMSIEEAVLLVMKSSQISKGGEIFLLDMGSPIKIIDLARKMIRLFGKSIKDQNNPFGDIEFKVIGLRPGEKLYEELLIDDNSVKTSHRLIFKSLEKSFTIEYFDSLYKNISDSFEAKNMKNFKKIIKDELIGYDNGQ